MPKRNKYDGSGKPYSVTNPEPVSSERYISYADTARPYVAGRNAQKRAWRELHGVRK